MILRSLALLSCIACGRIGFEPTEGALSDARGDGAGDGGGDAGMIDAAPACASFGPWGMASRVVSLSSGANDWEASVHPNSKLLLFASDRSGGAELYQSRYAAGAWGPPTLVPELNSGDDEFTPSWSGDGATVYFTRSFNNPKLYTASFNGTTFGTPVLEPTLGATSEKVVSPTVTADGSELFYSGFSNSITRATRNGSGWQVVGTVTELANGTDAAFPSLSADGLTIYFESGRTGNTKIYMSTRAAFGAIFSPPVIVTAFDAGGAATGDPDMAADGLTMMFSSDRTGAQGIDVFTTTRSCQ